MRRRPSLAVLTLLAPLALPGCLTPRLWELDWPFHRCPEVELVPTRIDAVPTGIVRAVRAGDGTVHLLCRCSDGAERHYATASPVEPPATWPAVAPPDEDDLPPLVLLDGPLPDGLPLVGRAPQDADLAARLGEAPSRWVWSRARFDAGLVLLEAEDGSTRPLARVPESRLALRQSPWASGPIRAPMPGPRTFVIGRALATPFVLVADAALTALFWPLLLPVVLSLPDCPCERP
ncbi:MAG: hypothetical protein M9894_23625 [Planctomycetes bacterium]|nr:hypothetical protein [Planctomycetota bacterium]